MGRAAIQAEEDAISGGGPCGAGVGTVEANGIARKIFEFTKLCVLIGSGDADASATCGGDGAVGFNVS